MSGSAELNSMTLQHFIGSIILIVPRSFKIAIKRKSLSYSNVLTDMGIIEITVVPPPPPQPLTPFGSGDAMAVRRNSVRLRRELDEAVRQLPPLDASAYSF